MLRLRLPPLPETEHYGYYGYPMLIDPDVVENPFKNVVSFEFPSAPTLPTMFARTPQQAFQSLKRMNSHIRSYKIQLDEAREGIEAARARLAKTDWLLVMSKNQLEFVHKFMPQFAKELFVHHSVNQAFVSAYQRFHPQVVVHSQVVVHGHVRMECELDYRGWFETNKIIFPMATTPRLSGEYDWGHSYDAWT